MKTGLITSDTYKNHNTGNGHPEKIDRVTAIIDNFKKVDNKNLIWKKPNKFDEFFLNKTHSIEYIKHVKQSFPKKGLVFLDGDTIVSPGSKEATKDELGIKLCNSGVMIANNRILFSLLNQIRNNNSAQEFYLTDIVHNANKKGLNVQSA